MAPKEILKTGLFSFEEAEQSEPWKEELNKETHTPETEEYGISSFVYHNNHPFDPERFWDYVQYNFPKNIIRSKGLFWIASRPSQALIWNQAGGSLRADSAGVWWASMSENERINHPAYLENYEHLNAKWDTIFGDRNNELVIIGFKLDAEKIAAELDACIATETELASKKWENGYNDDWPVERAYPLNELSEH